MTSIIGKNLYQWDVGRSVKVSDSDATHFHFANQGDSKAVPVEIADGEAKIPDFLLQTGKTLMAYAVLDGVTLESKSFAVCKREKPADYVYTETEVMTWVALDKRLTAIEENDNSANVVLHIAQNLTPAQQAQARQNIGAAAIGESGGSLTATDDGNGNVVVTITGGLSVTDDGNGNVVIQ